MYYAYPNASQPRGFKLSWPTTLGPKPVMSALLLIFAAAQAQAQAQYYASPTGTSTGDGTIGRPWSLATALSRSTTIKPGSTLWLRGGTYGSGKTLFKSTLVGSSTAPIKVRQYPGEHAKINGGIKADGSYTWFWGFEITSTITSRYVSNIDYDRAPGLRLYGRGNKAINLIINNTGRAGVAFWSSVSSGANNEVYGCILWGNGVYDSSGAKRGDAIYAHLSDPNPALALISNNITFRNFTLGIKGWTEWSERHVNNFQLVNNVSFDNSWSYDIEVADALTQLKGLKVIGNYTYQPASEDRNCTRFGTKGRSGGDAEVRDNYFVCGSTPLGSLYLNVQNARVTGNRFINSGKFVTYNASPSPSAAWDSNYYFDGGITPYRRNGSWYTRSGWRGLGYDANGTFSTGYPTVPKVVVFPNKYEAGRAHVVIYNWRRDSYVPVNLSSVLNSGDSYEIRDAQNYWGSPVARGTYNGTAVSFPTILTAVAPIPGATHFVNRHTDQLFNVYVVIKK
jgi:hypothetical protein